MKRKNLRPASRRMPSHRLSIGVVAFAAIALAGCASGPPEWRHGGTLYDAFAAQGFIAARDRLWQMDLWCKRGLGEMAKDFGPAWVSISRTGFQ